MSHISRQYMSCSGSGVRAVGCKTQEWGRTRGKLTAARGLSKRVGRAFL